MPTLFTKQTLPKSQETGLGKSTTKRVNERVQNVLDNEERRASSSSSSSRNEIK